MFINFQFNSLTTLLVWFYFIVWPPVFLCIVFIATVGHGDVFIYLFVVVIVVAVIYSVSFQHCYLLQNFMCTSNETKKKIIYYYCVHILLYAIASNTLLNFQRSSFFSLFIWFSTSLFVFPYFHVHSSLDCMIPQMHLWCAVNDILV